MLCGTNGPSFTATIQRAYGEKGLMRQHFSGCGITPTDNDIEIIGTERGYKLLTLEALFIAEIKPELNTKDEFRSRQLKLKF